MPKTREVTLQVTLGEPLELEDLCEECLHATLVQFSVHGLWEGGVMDLGILVACVGCYEDGVADGSEE